LQGPRSLLDGTSIARLHGLVRAGKDFHHEGHEDLRVAFGRNLLLGTANNANGRELHWLLPGMFLVYKHIVYGEL